MAISSLEGLSATQKDELVASLATLLVGSAAEPEITADKLQSVATAAGCSLSASMATLFASTVKDISKYMASPGGGGGGGGGGSGGGGGGGAAAEAAKEEEKEEEEEMDLGGGMDMFGGEEGGGGGGGDY